jgi:hypothetical protein
MPGPRYLFSPALVISITQQQHPVGEKDDGDRGRTGKKERKLAEVAAGSIDFFEETSMHTRLIGVDTAGRWFGSEYRILINQDRQQRIPKELLLYYTTILQDFISKPEAVPSYSELLSS